MIDMIIKQNKSLKYFLKKKIEFDELARFKYVNYVDMRPYVIKRCVVNELKADERKRFWKHFWGATKFVLKRAGLGIMLYVLLVLMLIIL